MPVKTAILIDEIRRVGHDDVSVAFNSRQYVAENRSCIGQIVKRRVDGAERQRLAIYVCEKKLSASAKEAGCEYPSSATTATDINEPEGLARSDIGKRDAQ
jgi:hypothetical protein